MDHQTDYNGLLDKCKHGDAAARELLFQHLQVRLRAILKYRLRGWAVADLDDILQDTLVVVTERLEQVETNPQLFALTVLRNKIGNRISLHRRRIQLSIDPTGIRDDDNDYGSVSGAASIPSPDDGFDAVQDRETVEALGQAIRKLSLICQALFTALLENRSVADTWDFFHTLEAGLSRSTFDKRLFDCRRKLRQLMARSL